MPDRPPRPCATPGCSALVAKGHCPAHLKAKRKALDAAKDPAWRRLYGLAAWKQLRAAHLSREPLCRACAAQGITTPADVVDHVTPHRGDLALFLDPANLQSLDKRCHDRKTADEVFRGRVVGPAGPAPATAPIDWEGVL